MAEVWFVIPFVVWLNFIGLPVKSILEFTIQFCPATIFIVLCSQCMFTVKIKIILLFFSRNTSFQYYGPGFITPENKKLSHSRFTLLAPSCSLRESLLVSYVIFTVV